MRLLKMTWSVLQTERNDFVLNWPYGSHYYVELIQMVKMHT